MNRIAKQRLARAITKHRQRIQRVETVEPNLGYKAIWRRPIVLWRALEVCGFAMAIWALHVSIESNKLTLAALEETKQQSQLALVGLDETRRQTGLSQDSLAITQREIERTRRVQAWQILATETPGNSGKTEALEFLHATGESLEGIDVSCAAAKEEGGSSMSCSSRTWLQKLELPGSNLRLANLSWTNLSDANLSNASMLGARLNNALLLRANLSGAKLVKANLSGAHVTNADLSQTFLSNSVLSGAKFSDSLMSGADLSSTYAINAVLENADLSNSNLSNAFLFSADLANTNFSSADLSNAVLFEADFSNANLSGANLSGADFSNANLSGANLSNTSLCGQTEPGQEAVCVKRLTQVQVQSAWAWADQPPAFSAHAVDLQLKRPPMCDPALRPAHNAKRKKGKPEGC